MLLNPVYQSIFNPYFTFNPDSKLSRAESVNITDNQTLGEDLASTWLLEDCEVIRERFFERVTRLKNLSLKATYPTRIKLINEYNSKLRKVHDDHRNVLVNEHTHPHLYFQPYDARISENMVTFAGLTRMAQIFTGQSRDFFTYVEIGTGLGIVTPQDDRLVSPLARMNVQDLGWFEPSGTTVQSGTMFAENTQSGIISEAAAFDRSVGGTCWWRIFITDPLKRVENKLGETVPTLSHIHTFKGK